MSQAVMGKCQCRELVYQLRATAFAGVRCTVCVDAILEAKNELVRENAKLDAALREWEQTGNAVMRCAVGRAAPLSDSDVCGEIERLRAEVERLKAGRFTEEEFQNLCHGFSECDFRRFEQGCREYQSMLFGFDAKAKAKRTPEWIEKASKRYEGKTVYCCECGNEYPMADLQLRSEIYCPKCRDGFAANGCCRHCGLRLKDGKCPNRVPCEETNP